MSQPRDDRQDDLFRPALEEIINLRHPLVRLAAEIDWGFLAGRFGSVCRAGPGQPPLPTRLVAGLFILKHMHDLSDEMLCNRWVENPYFQYFCGEVVFRHEAPFDRSSLTRWRQRLGEEQIAALLQESLSVAHRTGAIESKDRPSAWWWTPPCRRRRLRMRGQTRGHYGGATIRMPTSSSVLAQFKLPRTLLGRIIRDVRRKIEGDAARQHRFGPLLDLALRVRHQERASADRRSTHCTPPR